MTQLRGYTLIELLVVITIVSLLVTFGVSSYTKAQKNQIPKSASEVILSVLAENQKLASSGNGDCSGVYLGQQLVFDSGTNRIHAKSSCEGSVYGLEKTTEVAGITFSAGHVLTFRPLNQGIDLQSGDSDNLNFVVGDSTYQIQVERSGSIAYKGKQ